MTEQPKKETIKELLYIGLNFMIENFNDKTLREYIKINRATFTETGVVTGEEFDKWIGEWSNNHEKR